MTNSRLLILGLIASTLSACGEVKFSSLMPAKSSDKAQITEQQTASDSAVTEDKDESPLSKQQISTGKTEGEFENASAEIDVLINSQTGDVVRSQGNNGIIAGCVPNRSVVRSNVFSFRLEDDFSAHFGWGSAVAAQTVENVIFELGDCVAEDLKTESYSFCELNTHSTLPMECKKWSEVGGIEQISNYTGCKQTADQLSGISTNSFGQRSAPLGDTFFVCQKVK